MVPYEQDGVRVSLTPLSNLTKNLKKYLVSFQADTPTQTVIDTLRGYIHEYYTPEEETLKIEVCFD